MENQPSGSRAASGPRSGKARVAACLLAFMVHYTTAATRPADHAAPCGFLSVHGKLHPEGFLFGEPDPAGGFVVGHRVRVRNNKMELWKKRTVSECTANKPKVRLDGQGVASMCSLVELLFCGLQLGNTVRPLVSRQFAHCILFRPAYWTDEARGTANQLATVEQLARSTH
eukprot:TRINITY_DN4558_c0_g1_i15.p3 TRINITY_DN4558_c0_g1~~TRINITY_DN4558_c0_g1_i15.p3  ORF type:complete len:171 (+),score=16.01 TRINITY_DN4558_c0_g1_i15:191-703(+)